MKRVKKTLDLNKSSQNELFTNYLSFMFSWWYLFFSLSVLNIASATMLTAVVCLPVV